MAGVVQISGKDSAGNPEAIKSTLGAGQAIDPPLAGVIDDQGAGTVYIR